MTNSTLTSNMEEEKEFKNKKRKMTRTKRIEFETSFARVAPWLQKTGKLKTFEKWIFSFLLAP